MRLRAPRLTRAALLAVTAWACAAAPAGAAISFAPCGNTNHFACGHLTVPLDPSGAIPGAITLALRRHRAPVGGGEARSAIIALAGGPGQPALPLAEQFAELLGPAAATRDLIVFDQRGVGLSDPLSCHAMERPEQFRAIEPLIAACGAQLGPTRTLFTTTETVTDIEAIRQAGGYEKLVLYGTSYGTKVAEEYAQAHPDRVEALVLDSVVPPSGPDPLERSTFAAVPGVLRALCAARACSGITADPVADVARVIARIGRGPLSGRAIDGAGRPHEVAISAGGLIFLLLAGDFSPPLRAGFITALAAAARSDAAPLARLLASAAAAGGGEAEDFDAPLYFATSCEEQAFPWSRAAPPARRLAEARSAAAALPAATFAPFRAATALDLGDVRPCAAWPFTTPGPAPARAPLPAAPTLILSGGADLRTPTADARAVAALIPGSHLLVVPGTGHSVLGEEAGSCAGQALAALFSGHPVEPCARQPAPQPPPRPAPLRLSTVSALGGSSGRAGRTLHAVLLSIDDLLTQLRLQASLGATGGLGSPGTLLIGGLRAGWAHISGRLVRLHDYTYIPGVTVTGTIGPGGVHLTIGGRAASHGSLRAGGGRGTLAGTLGGERVSEAASSPATAAIVGRHAQASFPDGPRGPFGLRLAGRGRSPLAGRPAP
jgi:pimeloyl-ACP methyl ester carboxylesterase